MYLNYFTEKKVIVFVIALVIFTFSLGAGKFLFDAYINNYFFPSPNLPEISSRPHGSVLYLSGVPDNNFNVFPNVFSLSLPDGEFKQVTGVNEANNISMSYSLHTSMGNEFMLLPAGYVGAHTTFGPYIVYPASENSERREESLKIKPGLFSNNLTLAADAGRLAFVTHYPENEEIELEDIPDFNNFSTWTVAVLSKGEVDTERYFENAIKPVWASPDHLVFLKEDAIYYHDFTTGKTMSSIKPSDLNLATFTTDDSIAYISNSPENMKLILHKYDSNELFMFSVKQSENSLGEINIALENRLSVNPDMQKIVHILALEDDKVAVLQRGSESEKIVIYSVSTSELKPVHTIPLQGLIKNGTAVLDSWTSASLLEI